MPELTIIRPKGQEWLKVIHPEHGQVWVRRNERRTDEQSAAFALECHAWEFEPFLGSYDDEELYNDDTDHWDLRKFKITCPNCLHVAAPLCSPYTECVSAGWRWVGVDHQEPYSSHRAKCAKCGTHYRFDLHTPQ